MKKISFQERSSIFRYLSEKFVYVSRYESNGYADVHGRYEWIIAASNEHVIKQNTADDSVWEQLNECSKSLTEAPIHPCFLSYDLKNTTENLRSQNPDNTNFPEVCLWSPEVLLALDRKGELTTFGSMTPADWELAAKSPERENKPIANEPKPELSFKEYQIQFDKLMNHIRRGDIYEVNYCQRDSAIVKELQPEIIFDRLNAISPAPFACLHKVDNAWLICSSPERFLSKSKKTLISQPIKGTVRRSGDSNRDEVAMNELKTNPKERAENIMIVDLVRNDLSHFATKGSVVVDELCGIYPFATVSHMISTIRCDLKDGDLGILALSKAFPMGSMTGAPKIRAMQLIEESETFKRGIYSGACGYLSASGDFDFNVVIRSIIWNEETGFLSYATGSAITSAANGESEYNECLLKAEAMKKVLMQP
jgi:para-aminobenzoate synthetase component 1